MSTPWKQKHAAMAALTDSIQASINAYHTLLVRLSERTLPCRFEEAERRYQRLRDRRDREYKRLMTRFCAL